jgi:hypothetical protein
MMTSDDDKYENVYKGKRKSLFAPDAPNHVSGMVATRSGKPTTGDGGSALCSAKDEKKIPVSAKDKKTTPNSAKNKNKKYEIERVCGTKWLGRKVSTRKLYHKIHWKNYDKCMDSWELRSKLLQDMDEDILNEMVAEFHCRPEGSDVNPLRLLCSVAGLQERM